MNKFLSLFKQYVNEAFGNNSKGIFIFKKLKKIFLDINIDLIKSFWFKRFDEKLTGKYFNFKETFLGNQDKTSLPPFSSQKQLTFIL